MENSNDIIVEVTQDCIDNSERVNADSCAIATACKRLGYDDVSVSDGNDIRLNGARYEVVNMNHEKVNEFIVSFDDGASVEPMTIILRPYNPDPYYEGDDL